VTLLGRSFDTSGRPRPGGALRAWPVAALGALLVALTSFGVSTAGAAGTGSTVYGSGGTVTIRSIDDVDTFNPATTSAPNMSVQAIELTYDRLMYLNPKGKIEPYLATSWTTTSNSATLKIRHGATCADGSPVTPTVVANSLRYATAKSTAGPYTTYLTGSAGVKSVTANDINDTVTITLKAPYNALLTALATPYVGSIICPAGVANPKSLSAAPNGSGPYVLDQSQSVRGSVYVFTLRKNYDWGPGGWSAKKKGIPSKIIDRVVTDESTAANLLITGEVNIAPIFGINEVRVAANKAAYTFTTTSQQIGSWGVVFNQNAGLPGADPKVREAAYLALNTDSMIKAAFSNEGVAYNTETTPNMECYNKSVGKSTPGYDPSKARAILEQDGYKLSNGVMTKNGKPLKLRIVMWNATNQAGDYMQQALKQIGVESTVEITSIGSWLTALFTSDAYDLTVYAYYSGLPNPSIFPSQESSMSIHDAKYFALSAKAEQVPAATACKAWAQALTQSEKDFDVKPIGVSKNIWFGNGWKFAAPYDVVVDPFTLVKTS
jgi:peptide/nickel transport system substrate-binding protein